MPAALAPAAARLYDARLMPLSFTILGHACMLVEHGGRQVLVDPWLVGSCYWRSWWHFPKPVEATPDVFDVDAIYLTHGHFDHFHYPSLRKFDRSVKIILARFATDRMRSAVESIGFTNIVEISHGVPYALEGGLTVYSYQHGFDDSAVVIVAGDRTILNLNDSHVTGLALRQIMRRHPRIDFLFRSHAPAQGYPVCYQAEDFADLSFHRREDYIVRFLNSIQIIRPKFAIPFASNVCHLHSETFEFSKYNITPLEVARTCKAELGEGSPVVLMTPGDSWSDSGGFHLSNPDAYKDLNAVLSSLAVAARPVLQRVYEEEAGVQPHFETFLRYMNAFMRALPAGIRFVFCPVIVFDQPAAKHRYWVADFHQWKTYETDDLPGDTNSIVKVHPAVLMDALSKDILFFVHISKRMRIWVKKSCMREDFKFWGLVQLYEIGYLPLRNLMTPRAISVSWQRRFEILEMMRSAVRAGKFEEKAVPEVY